MHGMIHTAMIVIHVHRMVHLFAVRYISMVMFHMHRMVHLAMIMLHLFFV
ncbi:hypothetical protein CU017_1536 [Enterococcus lactis]|nr:hypothetical protein [Enterococcus lactis]